MEDTTEFLNENNIDWCVIPIKNKTTDWKNSGLAIVMTELYIEEEIKIACDKYVDKKLKLKDNKQTAEFLKLQFFGVPKNYFDNPVMLPLIQELYLDENQFKEWTIVCDTSNVIQLDIDVNDKDEFNKLSTAGKKLYKDIQSKFPFNKSQSKPMGFHSFIIDKNNAKLSTEIKKLLNHKNQYGETEHYKNKTEGKFIKKDYNFIEVMCGSTLHLSSPIENNKFKTKNKFKPLNPTIADNILKIIFKNKCFENDNTYCVENINQETINQFNTENSVVDKSTQDKYTNEDLNFEEISAYLNNIKQLDIDNTSTFCAIACAIARDKEDRFKQTLYDLGNKSSKSKTGKQDYNTWFDKLYRDCKFKSTFKNCNILRTLSRNSNITTHYEIYNTYSIQTEGYSPQELSDIYLTNNQENIIVSSSDNPELPPDIYLWIESHKKWSNETNGKYDSLNYAIYCDIHKYLLFQLDKYVLKLKQAQTQEDDDLIGIYQKRIKIIKIIISDILKTALRASIATCLIQKIKTLLPQKIQFDNEPNLLPFNNCIYDIHTKEIRDYLKTDYILRKIEYDYREPLEDNYIETKQFLYSLFPIELEFTPIDKKPVENRFRYLYRKLRFLDTDNLSNKNIKKWKPFEVNIKLKPEFYDLIYVLSMSLFGYMIPVIHIFNGEGCNGKSVLIDIMKRILGIYYAGIKGNNLCENIETSGASPSWAKLDMCRMVAGQEPDENKDLSVATIKYITEQEIEARMLYSNKTKIQLMCIWILVCNVVPTLDGVNNNALSRRIKDFNFPHKRADTFDIYKNGMSIERCEETGKVINATFQFKGVLNTRFADKNFQDEAKYSLLKYLLNFVCGFENIYGKPIHKYKWKYSAIVEERSKLYLGSNDRINEHFEKYIRICKLPNGNINKTKYIKLDELHTHFITNSEFYIRAKQSVKDKYKKQVFFKNVRENNYGIYYNADKEERVDGIRKKIGIVLEGFEFVPMVNEDEKNDECVIDSDIENEIGYNSEYSEHSLFY